MQYLILNNEHFFLLLKLFKTVFGYVKDSYIYQYQCSFLPDCQAYTILLISLALGCGCVT